MKSNKGDKRTQLKKTNDQSGKTNHHGKKTEKKMKYNHKNHWLEQDDDFYEMPKYKDEEE